MSRIVVKCEKCGREILRYPSEVRKNVFCSRQCSREFRSQRMKEYNKIQNPMNTSAGWTLEKREASSEREKRRHRSGENTYIKKLGRHEHRIVAEQMLGRKLNKGEVVHHKDGDKHNNKPENLMVFRNQQEHIKYHLEHPEESGAVLKRR